MSINHIVEFAQMSIVILLLQHALALSSRMMFSQRHENMIYEIWHSLRAMNKQMVKNMESGSKAILTVLNQFL